MKPGSAVPAGLQSMADGVCTQIMVSLRLKQDADAAQVMAMMREEMVATAKLYLDGRIQQWFSQVDERGVIFFFGTADLEATMSLMDGLPLVREGLVDLSYTRLGPLLPLRTLLTPP